MSESIGHNSGGTEFADLAGATEYARQCHGLDGRQLLDPFFLPPLVELSAGQDVIDIGCGASPWAIAAIKSRANFVFAFDLSRPMIGRSVEAIARLPGNKPQLAVANAMDIPARSESVGLALSINVGCNMPALMKPVYPVFRHFTEMNRVLRPGGWAVFTTPSSLKDTFTTSHSEGDAVSLQLALDNISDEDQMKKVVSSFSGILRATIVEKNGHWHVVQPEDSLSLGQPIWRKIPGLVVPNYYHPEEEYVRAIELAGFTIVDQQQPLLDPKQFASEENELGSQYLRNNAFGIYILQKI